MSTNKIKKHFSNDLGDLIFSIRQKLNLTQKQLAEKIGISVQSVSKLEVKKMGPSSQTIDKVITLARTHKISIRDFS